GPIIEPELCTISVTPICPHSLMGRTLIFSENRVIKLAQSASNNHPAYITIDGEYGAKLKLNEELIIRKSEKFAKFIKLTDRSFFEVLNQKLH
ncbi:MAG: NAD(+) kinase, partial [Oscillospiraceae bacterium]